MTKPEAIAWLIEHLEPRITNGGCGQPDCIICPREQHELTAVKETLSAGLIVNCVVYDVETVTNRERTRPQFHQRREGDEDRHSSE